MPARFEPSRFRSTVPYYLAYRPPYPDELVAFVAERCGLGLAARVLDLGCGPGQLAVAFARLGATVTAIDPEPDMLAAARRLAAEAGASLTTVEGSSYDLNPALGRFHLVTMGRSFHWMDRDATLKNLDSIVEQGGAVVLFGDRPIELPRPGWRALVEQLSEEFAPARASERRERKMSDEPHELVLLRSAFSRLERHGVIISRRLSADDVVGYAYSTSTTSPESLGDRRRTFEQALREALARISPRGEFNEVLEINALIARRPAAR